MAKYFPLTADQGDGFSIAFVVKDFNGTPVDLTGYSASGIVGTHGWKYLVPKFDLSVAITNPTAGVITVSATGSQMAGVTHEDFLTYQISITSGSGVQTKVFYGPFMVDNSLGVQNPNPPAQGFLSTPVNVGPTTSVFNAMYTETFSNATVLHVAHNLNTTTVVPVLTDLSGMVIQYDDMTIVDANNVTITFASPQSGNLSLLGAR